MLIVVPSEGVCASMAYGGRGRGGYGYRGATASPPGGAAPRRTDSDEDYEEGKLKQQWTLMQGMPGTLVSSPLSDELLVCFRSIVMFICHELSFEVFKHLVSICLLKKSYIRVKKQFFYIVS